MEYKVGKQYKIVVRKVFKGVRSDSIFNITIVKDSDTEIHFLDKYGREMVVNKGDIIETTVISES